MNRGVTGLDHMDIITVWLYTHPSPFPCRYNCKGLRFGKLDIGRYGEVAERSVIHCVL